MTYTPSPVDTSRISLPAELTPLLEQLAENTHDTWAAGRIAEGWTHGPKRNDDAKTHPCLVPYEKLSESEKKYDRQTSKQAIKFILANGYQIIKS